MHRPAYPQLLALLVLTGSAAVTAPALTTAPGPATPAASATPPAWIDAQTVADPEAGPASGPAAQAPTLDYGPHAVGFTVVEALDSSRAFRPLRDFRGRLAPEPARPVQVAIWYPADPEAGASAARRMRAGEFRVLRETELTPGVVLDEAAVARLRSEFMERAAGFGVEPARAARTWDDETPAVRDAPRLPGPHPALLYVGALGVSDPLLGAYLASWGFVVAALPNNGRMTNTSLTFSPNALTIDTRIDDIGFVYGVLRRLPWVDTRRLAVASFSGASLAALLWAMRDMQPAAVVTIEGWERYRRGADLIAGSVHYEPHRLRVPFLMLERADDETSPAYAKVPDVAGALPYADLTRVAFRDASHGDFLSHPVAGHTARHLEVYATSTRMIRRFLQDTLEGDADPFRTGFAPTPAPFLTISHDPAVGPVPAEEELFRLAETDPTAAAGAYAAAARIVPGHTLFREHVLARAARFADPGDTAVLNTIVRDAYPDTGATAHPLTGAGPAFLAVSVADLDDTAAWYGDVLGLQLAATTASADGALRVWVLHAPPVVVELIHHADGIAPADALDAADTLGTGDHPFRLRGLAEAGLFVEDLDRLFEYLRGRGVDMDERIGTDQALGLRSFVFRDPDGNRIQAFELGGRFRCCRR